MFILYEMITLQGCFVAFPLRVFRGWAEAYRLNTDTMSDSIFFLLKWELTSIFWLILKNMIFFFSVKN